jgi:hypothetical protein
MAKSNFNLRVDHENQQIVIGKAFSRKQYDIDSQEYKALCAVVQMFPQYKVSVKKIKKCGSKEAYKGLTYEYMEMYIRVKGTRADRQEYDDMRLVAKCHSKRFPVIKQWFLNKYEEVKLYGAKVEFLKPEAA